MFCYFDKNCDKSHILTHVGGGNIPVLQRVFYKDSQKSHIFSRRRSRVRERQVQCREEEVRGRRGLWSGVRLVHTQALNIKN